MPAGQGFGSGYALFKSNSQSVRTMQAPVFSRQPRLPSPFGQFVYTFPLFRRVPGAPCRPLNAQHPAAAG